MSGPSRSGQRLEWKVGVFTVGAVMALTGIFFEQRWLTGVAILVLVVGVFWRFPSTADSDSDGAPDITEATDPSLAPGPSDASE